MAGTQEPEKKDPRVIAARLADLRRAAAKQARALEALERARSEFKDAGRAARSAGATWPDIAAAAGLASREAAYQRFDKDAEKRNRDNQGSRREALKKYRGQTR